MVPLYVSPHQIGKEYKSVLLASSPSHSLAPKKIAGKSSKRIGSATKVRSGSIMSQASEEGGEGEKQPHPAPRELNVCVH